MKPDSNGAVVAPTQTSEQENCATEGIHLDSSESGFVHSVESCGTGDGPGIRFVVYLQGCPLRCQFCHNPDTRAVRVGRVERVDNLLNEIMRYKPYFKASGGGVTLSGGEPLLQPRFAASLLRHCKEAGFHTALDTSGYAHLELAKEALEQTDLVLLDLKSSDAATHHKVTGVWQDRILKFAEYLAEIKKPTWIRFVLVPGLNDSPENIEGVASIAASLGNVERVDVLPFHKMGEFKWARLGLPYTLTDTEPPRDEQVSATLEVFRGHGLKVY